MSLLEVKDLSVAFAQGGKTTTAVDRVSFTIDKGQTVALVGRVRIWKIGYRSFDTEASGLSRRIAPHGRNSLQWGKPAGW